MVTGNHLGSNFSNNNEEVLLIYAKAFDFNQIVRAHKDSLELIGFQKN